MKTDILIIGSGIAGLSFAIKTATARPDISVFVLTKSQPDVCNTSHAQGGIAVVLDQVKDSFQQHIEDTMKAGGGLSDPEVVKMVITQAPERLGELMEWGTSFDVNKVGELELGLEGGHSQNRIVHHRDFTGREMETKLLQKAQSLPNIVFYDRYFATDLLLKEESFNLCCTGVHALDTIKNQHVDIYSRITFLATGGSGRIFKNTTNPAVATADGVAMASRAGAKISNMNFIQFHPTALYAENQHALFLISEAVRGFGAYLINSKGSRFLFKYDTRGELATRDVVSEAILKELKNSEEEMVFIDCRHLNFDAFRQHFPTITEHCAALGIDIRKNLIPVVPAAHYQCGGIEVDGFGKTSIGNLFASGECANTGLHGANRLASNSLLEALVFSHQAAGQVLAELDQIPAAEVPQKEVPVFSSLPEDSETLADLRSNLNEKMTYDLLYLSGEAEKEKAILFLKELEEQVNRYRGICNLEYYELRNMVQVALLVVQQAFEYGQSPSTNATLVGEKIL